MPNTFDVPPSTNTASGMFPLLLVTTSWATRVVVGRGRHAEHVFAYATRNFALLAAALSAVTSY